MTHTNLLKSLLVTAFLLCLFLCPAPEVLGQTGKTPPPPPQPAPTPQPVFKPQTAPTMPPYKPIQSASVPKGWQKYEFGAVPFFSVMLPTQHEIETNNIQMGGTASAKAFTLSGETDEGVYIAHFVENLPLIAERMSEAYKQKFYEGMWQGFIQETKKELETNGILFKFETQEKREVLISGLKGQEHDFMLGPMKGRARVVLSEQRAFLVISMEMGDSLSRQATDFLNSLDVYAAK